MVAPFAHRFQDEGFEVRDGLILNSDYSPEFEKHYLKLRTKEGRLFADEEAVQLPVIRKHHPLEKEWKIRAHSSRKLISYLKEKQSNFIIEIGCGNGWLTHHIATQVHAQCCGIDINKEELMQGVRLFGNNPRITFLLSEWDRISFHEEIDSIVFAGSIQYFGDLGMVIRHVLPWLRPKGEVHIIDSPIYKTREVESARSRSADYFLRMGVPEMTTAYFHHAWDDLRGFKFLVKSRGATRLIRSFTSASPFPWVIVAK